MPPYLLIATIAASGGWIWLLARVRLRGNRHAATSVPNAPTPTAVAALLEAPDRDRDPAVINAAILELAERGVLEVIPADSQGPAMVRAAAIPPARELPAYQVSVVARVLARQGPNGRPLPLTALESEEDQAARTWSRGLHLLVRRDAVGMRLLQKPMRRIARIGTVIAGIGTSVLIAGSVGDYCVTQQSLIPTYAFLLLDVLAFGAMRWVAVSRLTPAGRAVLVGTRDLPALDPAVPRQVAGQIAVLPTQLAPLPRNQVWSNHGGTWHPLNVKSKVIYRRKQRDRLIPMYLGCMGWLAVALGVGHQHVGPPLPLIVLFTAPPAAGLLALLGRLVGRRRLPRRSVIRGQVAKIWLAKKSFRNGSTSRDYFDCTLDTGDAPHSVRIVLPARKMGRLQVGDVVEVEVNPRTRVVKDLRIFGPDPLL